jgi:4-hydroxyphenylpyruvate dioxygenase
MPAGAPLTQAKQRSSDKFEVRAFHHVEILCADAASSAGRFAAALGCFELAKSDMSTRNHTYASRVMASGSCRFVFTAPYGPRPSEPDVPNDGAAAEAALPNPHLTRAGMRTFVETHGMSVYAVGIHVADAARAFSLAVAQGATPKAPPRTSAAGDCTVAEVGLYPGSDCALRLISGSGIKDGSLAFLPGYARTRRLDDPPPATFGIARVDHIVGNVPVMAAAQRYLQSITGFHEFAEFTAEDVGTVDSGLNSVVLASDNEAVLLPINEPTTGGKRKSQIQTYLDQHGGPGAATPL